MRTLFEKRLNGFVFYNRGVNNKIGKITISPIEGLSDKKRQEFADRLKKDFDTISSEHLIWNKYLNGELSEEAFSVTLFLSGS
ncbi:MAG: hypothetical protein LBE34_00655 [Flavobacteriaceae bacterium]|jgi:hypothetical protein|nr:hypothetical protein [Flavobacteriaceae bacterium]